MGLFVAGRRRAAMSVPASGCCGQCPAPPAADTVPDTAADTSRRRGPRPGQPPLDGGQPGRPPLLLLTRSEGELTDLLYLT